GNFSLGISQMLPLNIFINISDLEPEYLKSNRILVQNTQGLPVSYFQNHLAEILRPSDIGLKVRTSEKTEESEIISDRIFLDSSLVDEIEQIIPQAEKVITYLANELSVKGKTTPYSFVSALPESILYDINSNEIIINRWLADDLDAQSGDTLIMKWFYPGPGNLLEEKSRGFRIKSITENNSRLSDPLLMPDFPGISGSTTCSAWDAGIPLLLDRIRDKDEDYWNRYRGTPKAFISYDAGREMWGNNFGIATALRFPERIGPSEIEKTLEGKLNPFKTGFAITDLKNESNRAAAESVDFSSLFLALGMFIIFSCIILLSLAVSTFLDSRKSQIRTYFALGFSNRLTGKMLFIETIFLALAGAVPGVFAGFLINMLIINSLNSVWGGAVQTNTLSSDFSIYSVFSGLLITILITAFLILIKLRNFLRSLDRGDKAGLVHHSPKHNLIFLLFSGIPALIILFQSVVLKNSSIILAFTGATLLFIFFILILRQYFLKIPALSDDVKHSRYKYSKQFFSFHPAQAITPVIFIAAGIFAVIITGANRQVLTDKMLRPEGGTGGYLLWAESAVPVKENLNSAEGRREFGFNDPELEGMSFVQAKRVPGNDASCLNLNYISAPSILGIDPSSFIRGKSFSFATVMQDAEGRNPWTLLNDEPGNNVIYGIADQTVLQWGLKIKTGDTLVFRDENGQLLNVVIAAGLKSSVFQGYLLIGAGNFDKYYPSIPGSSIFLINGKPGLAELYKDVLSERLSGHGVAVEYAGDKLASFFRVTNTYLDIFTLFGALGMILGVAGLAFILIRNFNQRRSEFALMMATGYSPRQIRSFVLKDHILLLIWGTITGTLAGLAATIPSLAGGSEMPWRILTAMVMAIIITGLSALYLSVRTVKSSSLLTLLRKE
ncbi:MAG: hypothetical protein JXB49_01245, partial [Bacteroidales bacterium]|nr:hypothetical protein [Bacteroidales bacterium]